MLWGVWIAAICVDLGGLWFAFRLPGVSALSTADRTVDPGHRVEHCGLSGIIALGESIIVTGATFAKLRWTPEVCSPFGSAFVATGAMWWVYFVLSAEAAIEAFAHHKDRGEVARAGDAFGHLPIVAGIVATKSDTMTLTQPIGNITDAALAVTLAGPALFLVGAGQFCRLVLSNPPISSAGGILLLAGLRMLGPFV